MQEVSKVKILLLIPTKFIIISKRLTIVVKVGKINNIYNYILQQVQMRCSVYLECVDLKLIKQSLHLIFDSVYLVATQVNN